MPDPTASWPTNLKAAYPGLFGATIGLEGVPANWRQLLVSWAQELVEAGALEAGVTVESVKQKYNTLRADLRCPKLKDQRWEALEVSLEDRSEAIEI